MMTHVVLWNLKPELTKEQKEAVKSDMKKHLEGLVRQVPGLLSVHFITEPYAGSTHEVALVTTHEKPEDVAVYGSHPAHVSVADTYVRPYTCDRACLNF